MPKQSNRLRTAAVVSAASLAFLAPVDTVGAQAAPAELHRTSIPISDELGRIQYLIDFVKGTHDQFSDVDTAPDSDRFAERHGAQARNMARAFEKRYGTTVINMTSYVGDSVTAYLTPEVLEQVRNDPAVSLVTEAGPVTFSGPPWSDSTASPNPWSTQMQSYGWYAMGGKLTIGSLNLPRIYLVDGGVGYHTDLTNVTRVNPNPGTPALPVVACYSHATHVASIISSINNSTGTLGILPGAPIWSVSVTSNRWNDASGVQCGDPYSPPVSSSVSTPSIAAALDWVKHDIIYNGLYRVGIVNISMNGGDFVAGYTLGNKIADLATPYVGGFVYMGAFVVESAGNNNGDACFYAYSNTSTTDGIMVVGGVTNAGTRATSFTNSPYTDNEPHGSNYGSCVEIWAPSTAIWGAWGPDTPLDFGTLSTWQLDRSSTPYSNYGVLGGTSFAAPHITALAAYLTAMGSLGSPSSIESAVRSQMYTASYMDHGAYIYYGYLPP